MLSTLTGKQIRNRKVFEIMGEYGQIVTDSEIEELVNVCSYGKIDIPNWATDEFDESPEDGLRRFEEFDKWITKEMQDITLNDSQTLALFGVMCEMFKKI